MSEKDPTNLPWLDRLRMDVPGYGGYDERRQRRSAAYALRDALSRRLSNVRTQIDRFRDSCESKNLMSEIRVLDQLGSHIDRLLERVGGLGTRVGTFYDGPDLDSRRLDPVYALDHAILKAVDTLATRFGRGHVGHDLLAEIESDLRAIENKLDERAMLIRQLN